MKINFIIPFTGLTGGIKIVFEYCNRLKEKGHDVEVYVPMKAYSFNNSDNIVGKIKTLKSSIGNVIKRGSKISWFDLKVKLNLVPIISDKFIRNADATIATAWPTAYDVEKLSVKKGKKVYFIQHYETWSGPIEKVDNSYKLNLNQVVIAKWLQTLMKERFLKDSQLIYNGIENEMFFDGLKNNNENITCCILYNKLPWKGFEDGLNAFKIARNKHSNIKLKVFGIDKIEFNLEDGIEFYHNPSRELLKEIYSKSHIYIFPSKKEGWGLTILEAMANKCAVIGTNTGALEDIGKNNYNSMISSIGDVEQLANNLIDIIENNEKRKFISENGYKLALDFKWEKSVEKLEAYLESLN